MKQPNFYILFALLTTCVVIIQIIFISKSAFDKGNTVGGKEPLRRQQIEKEVEISTSLPKPIVKPVVIPSSLPDFPKPDDLQDIFPTSLPKPSILPDAIPTDFSRPLDIPPAIDAAVVAEKKSHHCKHIKVFQSAPGVFYNISHCPEEGRVLIDIEEFRSAAFTLRIVGSRQLTTVETNSRHSKHFELKYQTCYRGLYKAFLRVIFDDPVYDFNTNCMVRSKAFTSGGKDRVEWLFNHTANMPEYLPCSNQWTWPEGLKNFTEPQHFDEFRDNDGKRAGHAEILKGLNYNFHPFISKSELQKCLLPKHICTLGDSQVRMLTNSMGVILTDTDFGITHQKTELFNSTYFTFHWLNYDYLFRREMMEGCDIVVVNFGHWPLSGMDPDPLSPERYITQVKNLFDKMKPFVNDERKIFWLASNPCNIGGGIIL
jgi:hypothetical protein